MFEYFIALVVFGAYYLLFPSNNYQMDFCVLFFLLLAANIYKDNRKYKHLEESRRDYFNSKRGW